MRDPWFRDKTEAPKMPVALIVKTSIETDLDDGPFFEMRQNGQNLVLLTPKWLFERISMMHPGSTMHRDALF